MYKVEAIIRGEKLQCVKDTLDEAGFSAMTVTDVRGRGRQKGITLQWRAGEYIVDLINKVKLEIAVSKEEDVERIVGIICDKATTGEVGDGKIFVYPLTGVIRVRTKENGEIAI